MKLAEEVEEVEKPKRGEARKIALPKRKLAHKQQQ